MKKRIFYFIMLLGLLFVTSCNKKNDINDDNPDEQIIIEDIKVSFESNGGSIVNDIVVKRDQRISNLSTPTKVGYDFNGWYIDRECTVVFDTSTKLTYDITLYADWTAKKLSINVITNLDSYSVDVNFGDTFNILKNPSKYGYVFKGFYLDSVYEIKLDKNSVISDTTTIYGYYEPVKYTVNIVIDEENTNTQKFDYLSSLSSVVVPSKENAIFDGFFYDKDCTKSVSLDSIVTNDLTIYCKWIDTLNVGYTVKYMLENVNGNGYGVYSSVDLYGELGSEVFAELKEINGATLTSSSVSGIVSLEEKLELEVYYTRNKYNITYYVDENVYSSQTDVTFGSALKILLTCENGESIFRGWYTDAALTKKNNYKSMPASDINLYAKFESVIEGTEGLEYTLNSTKNGYIVTGYNGMSSKVIIPNGYNKLPVLQVKSLSESTVIEELVISNNVTAILNTAFVGCVNLSKLTLPTTLKTIDLNTFDDCIKLTSITIPKNVTSDLFSLFKDLTLIEEINVASGHTKYYSYEGVLYSKSDKSLVLYPQGKKSTSFTIAETTLSINYYSFFGNKYLENVVINDNLTSIYADAFLDCTNLKSITIGNSTSFISDAWLGNNPNLTCITVSSKNVNFKDIDGVLYSFDETKLLNYPSNKNENVYIIPSNVKFIGYNAFNNLSILEKLVVSSNVETIDYSAINDKDLFVFIENENLPIYSHLYAFKNVKTIYFLNEWYYKENNPIVKEEVSNEDQ